MNAPAPRDSVPPLLERWGARFLLGRGAVAARGEPTVHVLDDDEQRALARIERGAVARAAFAGVLSALASGVTEVYAGRHFALDGLPTREQWLGYVGVYGLVTLVASVLEIVYLYWDALRSVSQLAAAAGLRLDEDDDERRLLAAGLARAALELPEADKPVLGVDPRRESSRAMLLFASVVYKLKVGVSSFLFKAIVRRALGRFATRQLLAFAAVPVNALWNAIVTFLVLREARVRVMGPSAIEAHLDELLRADEPLTDEVREAIARAVASSIVRTERAHPNLVQLLRRVLERLGPFEDALVLDDTRAFLAQLSRLPERDRARVARVLAFAAILDGRFAGAEERLLRDAFSISGGAGPSVDEVVAAKRAFVHGRPFGFRARELVSARPGA